MVAMKAVLHEKYGPPEVLRLGEFPKPTPKGGEVLVRVHAATVNRTDCAILRAKPWIMRLFVGLFKPKRPITGTDFAGVVEAVGEHTHALKVGDAVFGFADMGIGSHAEYMTVSEDDAVASKPPDVSFTEAAASIEGAHYARNFINKVDLQAGDEVLINGATGAIGSAMVQLVKAHDARVTAVCGTDHVERVRSLGADAVIDYQREDFTQSPGRYRFVFDAVGKSTFWKCRRLLDPKGTYISSEPGWMAQDIFLALLTPLFGGRRVVVPFPTDRKASVLLVKEYMEEGKFRPLLDRTHPMDEVVEAFRYVESGEKVGNVVLKMSPGSTPPD